MGACLVPDGEKDEAGPPEDNIELCAISCLHLATKSVFQKKRRT